jgi:hypothetical protein
LALVLAEPDNDRVALVWHASNHAVTCKKIATINKHTLNDCNDFVYCNMLIGILTNKNGYEERVCKVTGTASKLALFDGSAFTLRREMNPQFSPSLFVQSLVAPSTGDLADEVLSKHKRKRGKGSRWILDDRLSPADLYVYLKARFGPPNGVIMIVRGPHSDNFIQWHYTLKSSSSTFEILGMNTRTEFLISDYPALGNNDWTELVESIKRDFSRFGPKMKEVRKQLEKWQLFYNPYHRLDTIVKKHYEELSEITKSNLDLLTDPPAFPSVYSSEEDSLKKRIDEFISRIQGVSDKYRRLLELSTNLRLICPVWAEAFINFLIFVLARGEIKNDNRLYQDFIRRSSRKSVGVF